MGRIHAGEYHHTIDTRRTSATALSSVPTVALKPGWVMMNECQEKHSEGTYYLDWTEDGKRSTLYDFLLMSRLSRAGILAEIVEGKKEALRVAEVARILDVSIKKIYRMESVAVALRELTSLHSCSSQQSIA